MSSDETTPTLQTNDDVIETLEIESVKIKDKRYVLGAMGGKRLGDKSLYFFELNKKNKFINLEQVKVFQRIRDLVFNKNKLYLFLERPSSIGVISIN